MLGPTEIDSSVSKNTTSLLSRITPGMERDTRRDYNFWSNLALLRVTRSSNRPVIEIDSD